MTAITLAEDLALLLCTNTFDFLTNTQTVKIQLGGAVLTELVHYGRIAIDGKHLVLVDSGLTGAPLLDRVLARMAAQPKRRKLKWWIKNVPTVHVREGHTTDLLGRVRDSLVDRGALRVEHRGSGFFATTHHLRVDRHPGRPDAGPARCRGPGRRAA